MARVAEYIFNKTHLLTEQFFTILYSFHLSDKILKSIADAAVSVLYYM